MVHMIGHDHEWTESVMAKLDAALHGIADGLGDFIRAQKLRPTSSRVQLSVEPHKCLAPRRPCAAAGSGRGSDYHADARSGKASRRCASMHQQSAIERAKLSAEVR